MAIARTYATAGAFRRALEERLKSMSQTEQIDINRLRRQVSFDRLLARLFRDRDIYLTPLTLSSSVWGHGRGFSEDIA